MSCQPGTVAAVKLVWSDQDRNSSSLRRFTLTTASGIQAFTVRLKPGAGLTTQAIDAMLEGVVRPAVMRALQQVGPDGLTQLTLSFGQQGIERSLRPQGATRSMIQRYPLTPPPVQPTRTGADAPALEDDEEEAAREMRALAQNWRRLLSPA